MELQLDSGKYQVAFKDTNLDVIIDESATLNVVVGDNARIEVGEAINYIKTGTAEIDEAVRQGLTQIDVEVEKVENYANSAQLSAEMAYQYRSSYIHDQGIASSEWTINHNLNKYPSVTVVDSAGNEVIAEVNYPSVNTCVVIMTAAFKGKAYLN